jgi:hypothetical protein
MSESAIPASLRRIIGAASIALLLPLPALALDSTPSDTLSVRVYADRYVAAGTQFSDVESLAAWAGPARTRVLALDSCGPAATAPLLAAVERFHRVYVDGVRIRTFAPGAPACVGGAEPPRSTGAEPTLPWAALPYYASDTTGRSSVP